MNVTCRPLCEDLRYLYVKFEYSELNLICFVSETLFVGCFVHNIIMLTEKDIWHEMRWENYVW
jgi:hypothetical protein